MKFASNGTCKAHRPHISELLLISQNDLIPQTDLLVISRTDVRVTH